MEHSPFHEYPSAETAMTHGIKSQNAAQDNNDAFIENLLLCACHAQRINTFLTKINCCYIMFPIPLVLFYLWYELSSLACHSAQLHGLLLSHDLETNHCPPSLAHVGAVPRPDFRVFNRHRWIRTAVFGAERKSREFCACPVLMWVDQTVYQTFLLAQLMFAEILWCK